MTINIDIDSILKSADGIRYSAYRAGDKPVGTSAPFLAFSDLANGADTGIGDGTGSGAIVTVWGARLGSSQGTSTIEFVDNLGTARACTVYYWKNADGVLPGGPVNLYESHGFQEVAFSIPASASGAGQIRITTNQGTTNTLPFTVRTGNIYHVKSTGNDSTGDGSFNNPWLTFDQAVLDASGNGPVVYLHDITAGSAADVTAFYLNTPTAQGSLANQWAVTAYPNTRPTGTGTDGFTPRNVDGVVCSKLDLYASEHSSVDVNGQPSSAVASTSIAIRTSKDGRVVANRMSDIAGWCAAGNSGAIKGDVNSDNDRMGGCKIFGNEIHDYGCEGSNKLHHTTYFTNRSPSYLDIDPIEIGWNYLHDNWAKHGIHVYDQDISGDNGDWLGEIKIHNNVVVNQGGAGINVSTSGALWTNDIDIYNNIAINTGLASDWDGVDVETAQGPVTAGINLQVNTSGTVNCRNNIVYKWNDDDLTANVKAGIALQGSVSNATINIVDNVIWTDKDKEFIGYFDGNSVNDINILSGNAYYTTASSPSLAIAPPQDATAITTDPLLTFDGTAQISVGAGSPLIGASSTTLGTDIYGVYRSGTSNVGAVE